MPLSSAEAFAPATVANLGIGFDILGLAVDGLGDWVRAERRAEPGVVIEAITGDDGRLPRDAARNTAGIAAAAELQAIGATEGVALTIRKGLPLASGLGSSAASAVAAAVAVNAAFGEPLPREALLAPSLEGEAAVSGYHADNVAPCLFGGITLSFGLRADQIIRLTPPPRLLLALVTPHVEVPTAHARSVLPPNVALKVMIAQTAGVARLMHALAQGDVAAMAAAMESDTVIEPARAHLMPLLYEAREAAKQAGALGLVISGAGPTLCAVCDTHEAAEHTATRLHALYQLAGYGCSAHVSRVLEQGAYVHL
jgi:homoserine kinase